MNKKPQAVLLKETIDQVQLLLGWLNTSYNKCKIINLDAELTDDHYESFEALTSRFARASDILIQKAYRTIDEVELTTEGSILDAVNRAEKRHLIDTVKQIRNIRDLRNNIAHEYTPMEFKELFVETLALTPTLDDLMTRTIKYCENLKCSISSE